MRSIAIAFVAAIAQPWGTEVFADTAGRDHGISSLQKTLIPLTRNEPFGPARAKLIKHGWRPAKVTSREAEYIGPDTRALSRVFPEVDSCSMDTASCIMYYEKPGTCLRIDTVGETVKVMKVVAWSRECSGNSSQP